MLSAPTSRKRVRRLVVALTASTALLATSGCSSLPFNSDPQVLRPFVDQIPTEPVVAPVDGRPPDLLLRDFYAAAARPTQGYQAARAFLTEAASEKWKAGEDDSTLIVERIDINSEPGLSDGTRTFEVSGHVIGRLAADGAYIPENGSYQATVEMSRQGNQWRISNLPSGVVLERSELRNQYVPHQLHFLDPSGKVLVSDRRWIYAGQSSLDAVLVNLLLAGPSANLGRGVLNMVPPTAAFSGVNNGVYEFTGMGDLTPAQRILFGAQLVWTLADAGIPGPYSVVLDGFPLTDTFQELTTDDFAAFNPAVSTTAVSALYAVNEGHLQRVGNAGLEPVLGPAGLLQDVASADAVADLSTGGTVAVVHTAADGRKSALSVGVGTTEFTTVLEGDTLTRPSFEFDSTAVWTVVDGHEIVRVVKSPTTGEFARSRVRSASLDDIDGAISVLRLSPSGVRVAMIINGRVYVGVVEQDGSGGRRISSVSEIAPALAGTALTLDWMPNASLIVGTSSVDTPVWRVEQDGAGMSALPSGNVTGPVVAVASTSSTLYLTDKLAIRQLSVGDEPDNRFWREVPWLQGVRAAPVVPH